MISEISRKSLRLVALFITNAARLAKQVMNKQAYNKQNGFIPVIYLLGLLLGVNILSFTLFGLDKLLAILHWHRLRERTLIAVALAGGCLGGLLGMMLFRHKTKKISFQLPLVIGILIEIVIMITILPFIAQ